MKLSSIAITLAITAACVAGVWLRYRLPPVTSVPAALNPEPTLDSLPDGRRRAVARALRDDGLHAAARASGGTYVGRFDPNESRLVAHTIESLGTLSDLIVVGRAMEGTARLGRGGHDIDTYWTVHVAQTIKGPVMKEILVRVPGGRIKFDDGTQAEMVAAGGEFGLVPGTEYALFLKPVSPVYVHLADDPARTIYAPVGTADGVFDLTSGNGVVKSQARSGAPVRTAVEGESRELFLDRLPARTLNPRR